ncbi:hypothetical protein SLEP1_g15529 [Rubroshorea leprosula]|uniref:Uncharacterized protein n=1 Tax=Rubroshorea leprosula TaxID=152421 RepID=A0AAV5IY49_9ROSI|nr:hypothetical protein SLEP1_g15529 [Rubroshorea leprosula]
MVNDGDGGDGDNANGGDGDNANGGDGQNWGEGAPRRERLGTFLTFFSSFLFLFYIVFNYC